MWLIRHYHKNNRFHPIQDRFSTNTSLHCEITPQHSSFSPSHPHHSFLTIPFTFSIFLLKLHLLTTLSLSPPPPKKFSFSDSITSFSHLLHLFIFFLFLLFSLPPSYTSSFFSQLLPSSLTISSSFSYSSNFSPPPFHLLHLFPYFSHRFSPHLFIEGLIIDKSVTFSFSISICSFSFPVCLSFSLSLSLSLIVCEQWNCSCTFSGTSEH
ncbi:unnamed protein product [Acanthosepion pharaonis]|uniref:Uncharacterized protein n=1 Tax=Acanthosepion pharaonis TaxID=158019 RepID=A0A812CX08_ACAPH|nr:unnamed protein product [Sepia pharaonis]